MSPLPTGTEVDGAIPYAGQFFDKGGAVYNVMHPDFGAKGDGTTDDGPAWNLAVTNMPTAGGTIVVPQGAYVLTTAFSFASKDDITLWLMPGVVLTGSALPTPSGNNAILDWRDGGFTLTGPFKSIGIDDNATSLVMTIDSSERVIIGHSASVNGHPLEVMGNALSCIGLFRYNAAASGPNFEMGKSRHGTIGSHTIVQDDDVLGRIDFAGSNGSIFVVGAKIEAFVDGTPGASTDMPTRLVFSTVPDGSATPAEGLKIEQDQKVSVAKVLAVNGASLISNDSTFALLNATPTTINFAGAATALNVGAAAGITTLKGDLVVSGVGPHTIGGSNIDYVAMHFTGAFTSGGASTTLTGILGNQSLTGASGDTGSLVAMRLASTILTQSANEDIGYIAQLAIEEPNITNNLGGSNVPDVCASLYVLNAADVGTIQAALYVKAGEVISVTHGYTMKEVTTPTALADHGRLYTKADNALYFQDGAGTEHTVTIS